MAVNILLDPLAIRTSNWLPLDKIRTPKNLVVDGWQLPENDIHDETSQRHVLGFSSKARKFILLRKNPTTQEDLEQHKSPQNLKL
jgi:hypothetical protein